MNIGSAYSVGESEPVGPGRQPVLQEAGIRAIETRGGEASSVSPGASAPAPLSPCVQGAAGEGPPAAPLHSSETLNHGAGMETPGHPLGVPAVGEVPAGSTEGTRSVTKHWLGSENEASLPRLPSSAPVHFPDLRRARAWAENPDSDPAMRDAIVSSLWSQFFSDMAAGTQGCGVSGTVSRFDSGPPHSTIPIVAPLSRPDWRAREDSPGLESEPDEPVRASNVMLLLFCSLVLLAAAVVWGLFKVTQ